MLAISNFADLLQAGQYNLEIAVLKLLHLKMRKASSHIYPTNNNYVQP